MKKKWAALLLALGMLLSVLPCECFASGDAVTVLPELSYAQQNPLYADELPACTYAAPQLNSQYELPDVSIDGDPTYLDHDGVVAALRAGMVARQTTITVYYQTTGEMRDEDLGAFVEEAMAHTGNPKEGDYLRWQYGSYRANTHGYIRGNTSYNTVTYTMTWYTTAAQETEVDTFVADFLSSAAVTSATTDYEKVLAIYTWLTENVTYDYANLNDSAYLLKYTAYAAAIQKTAVCQGYANLFYRLALECGLDARLIAGTAGGGSHAWNIVYLGGRAYLLDATWDCGRAAENWKYFLRGSGAFSADHRPYVDEIVNDYYYGSTYDYAVLGVSAEDYVQRMKYDVNSDDAVDIYDLQSLYEYLCGEVLMDAAARTVADCNGDGEVNILDYQAMYDVIIKKA